VLLLGPQVARQRRHDPQLRYDVLPWLLVRLHRHSKVLRLLLPGAAAGRCHKNLLLLLQLDLWQGHREHLLLVVLLGVLLAELLAVLQLGVLLCLYLRALQLRGSCRLQALLDAKLKRRRAGLCKGRTSRAGRLHAAVVLAQPVALLRLLLRLHGRPHLLLQAIGVLLSCTQPREAACTCACRYQSRLHIGTGSKCACRGLGIRGAAWVWAVCCQARRLLVDGQGGGRVAPQHCSCTAEADGRGKGAR
jgi:hypothetical protein